jgi:hypothetical protein
MEVTENRPPPPPVVDTGTSNGGGTSGAATPYLVCLTKGVSDIVFNP